MQHLIGIGIMILITVLCIWLRVRYDKRKIRKHMTSKAVINEMSLIDLRARIYRMSYTVDETHYSGIVRISGFGEVEWIG